MAPETAPGPFWKQSGSMFTVDSERLFCTSHKWENPAATLNFCKSGNPMLAPLVTVGNPHVDFRKCKNESENPGSFLDLGAMEFPPLRKVSVAAGGITFWRCCGRRSFAGRTDIHTDIHTYGEHL